MKRAILSLFAIGLGVITGACGDQNSLSSPSAVNPPQNPVSNEKLVPMDDTIVWAG